MNVTALKSMRAHWGTMMALLLHVRQALPAALPGGRAGWTVGHLERLSTCVLALPTWLLMRQPGAASPTASCIRRCRRCSGSPTACA
jgi:hypothetical protein